MCIHSSIYIYIYIFRSNIYSEVMDIELWRSGRENSSWNVIYNSRINFKIVINIIDSRDTYTL